MALTIGLSLLATATIGMIVWFRRTSPQQAQTPQREWTPVDAPPASFAWFLGQLRAELDEDVPDSFLIRVIEDGLTIYQAVRLRLLESKEGGGPVSTEAEAALETAADSAPKSAKPDKDSPKRRPSR